MKTKTTLTNLIALALAVMTLATACGGEVVHETDSRHIPTEGATSAQAVFDFRAGNLTIQGGLSGDLVDAELIYNVRKEPPQVVYSVSGSRGDLFMGVPNLGGAGASFGGDDNIWKVLFNEDIPIELILETSDADTTLELSDVLVTQLKVQQNGRGLDATLSGENPNLTAIDLGANAGTMTLILTGHSPVLETISADINANILMVDLNGEWSKDLQVMVEGGTNNSVVLDLPEDVGVQVEVASDKVVVSAESYSENGGVYTNQAFGTTEVAIYLTIDFKSGDLELK